MSRDSRLSGMLHVLIHMAEQDGALTSEALAKAMDTHPVALRRTLAGLRVHGLVRSEKGHGGGWRLGRPLSEMTLRDVHAALGSPPLVAIGNRSEAPACLVELAVNAALTPAVAEAEAQLLSRFGEVTLESVRADFRKRLSCRGGPHHLEDVHER